MNDHVVQSEVTHTLTVFMQINVDGDKQKGLNRISSCDRCRFIMWRSTNMVQMTSWSWAQMDYGT